MAMWRRRRNFLPFCDEELMWNEELWDGRIMGWRMEMKNLLWNEWKNCGMKNWLWGCEYCGTEAYGEGLCFGGLCFGELWDGELWDEELWDGRIVGFQIFGMKNCGWRIMGFWNCDGRIVGWRIVRWKNCGIKSCRTEELWDGRIVEWKNCGIGILRNGRIVGWKICVM